MKDETKRKSDLPRQDNLPKDVVDEAIQRIGKARENIAGRG